MTLRAYSSKCFWFHNCYRPTRYYVVVLFPFYRKGHLREIKSQKQGRELLFLPSLSHSTFFCSSHTHYYFESYSFHSSALAVPKPHLENSPESSCDWLPKLGDELLLHRAHSTCKHFFLKAWDFCCFCYYLSHHASF